MTYPSPRKRNVGPVALLFLTLVLGAGGEPPVRSHSAATGVDRSVSMSAKPGAAAARKSSIDAYITGATDVSNSPSCRLRYEVVITDGQWPTSFTWNTDGVIKEDYGNVIFVAFPVYPGSGDPRFVQVTMTDGSGGSTTVGLDITAGSNYDMCYT